ncbi:acetyl-CoA synthetase-like protein [Myriangium duriaei CBS 260.36]|uniref:Acetyl-CoA synthetase-like protein n=1 Tax=Myriangium duriaei CBS 260.36 TaxID=1168546 RepID=A0A9P4J940_9PEZI|nr:acetyl-CoA synthetase-like protein [Myriangium duriaei CBS 260.36]
MLAPNNDTGSLPPDAALSTDTAMDQQLPTKVERCLHDLVLESVHRQPDAVAVISWDGDLSYSELEEHAARLAAHLVKIGTGPEVKVGLCMEKSRWTVVAMLAIVKAGGVVVPIGTQHPLSRIQTILNDTETIAILTDKNHEVRLADLGVQTIAIDSDFLNTLSEDDYPLIVGVSSANAVWIVYTSGSTGTPKGVVIEHAALCTNIKGHSIACGFSPHTRCLQFAAHTFDAVITEVFSTLVNGGVVCIPSEHDRLNNLASTIDKMGVNFALLTSTVAGLLNPARAPSMKTIVLVGESVKPAVVEAWLPHAKVLNGYGPSECSIFATCSRPIVNPRDAPVIGFPVSCCAWVTNPDDYNSLRSVGEPGELLVEGPTLARGYLNDWKKTQQAFVTDPGFVRKLGVAPGRRMYRTGDLVRRNADGSLTYIGRRDTQIKIHGQRVEIGEIEHHLTTHPAVREAVVVKASGGTFEGRLCTALVLDGFGPEVYQGSELTKIDDELRSSAMQVISDVQRHLSKRVMQYMVPACWVPAAILPVNLSGKIDRMSATNWFASLKSDTGMTTSKDEESSCASTTEGSLRKVWSEVLKIPLHEITLGHSFLRLGGDSILAMQVVSDCRYHGLNISVKDVLESRTLSELALVAENFVRLSESSNSAAVGNLHPAKEFGIDWGYWDLEPDDFHFDDLTIESVEIDQKMTSLLMGDANDALRTDPVELLLAASLYSFSLVFDDRETPSIFLEDHGLELGDVNRISSSKTGRLTGFVAVRVHPTPNDIIAMLKQTKERRRDLLDRKSTIRLARIPWANHLDQSVEPDLMELLLTFTSTCESFQSSLERSKIPTTTGTMGDVVSVSNGWQARVPAAITIEAGIHDQKLQIRVAFSKRSQKQNLLRWWVPVLRDTINNLVHNLVDMETCISSGDFPLAKLAEEDLLYLQQRYVEELSLNSTADIEDVLPCSPIQQGILLSQEKESATYIVQQFVEFLPRDSSNPVLIDRLIYAWRRVVDRHSIMRTVFTNAFPGQQKYFQVVLKHTEAEVVVIELEDDQVRGESSTRMPAFDHNGKTRPPHRLTISVTPSGRVYARFELSHALTDAMAMEALINDLCAIYDGSAAGNGSNYGTYIAYLESSSFEDDLDYWSSLLRHSEPCKLPLHEADVSQMKGAETTRSHVSTHIRDLTALHSFRQNHEITIATIFQLAWSLVLKSRTGLNNTCFGYLSSGRDVPIEGVEGLLGPTINIIPCSTQFKKGITVVEAARNMQSTFLEGFMRQLVPLQAIQHSLRLSGQPLFNTVVSYRAKRIARRPERSSILVDQLAEEDHTEYDMTVQVVSDSDEIVVTLEYPPEKVAQSLADGLLEQLNEIVETLCQSPDCLVSHLPLISKHDLVWLKARGISKSPKVEFCVHALVQRNVMDRPNALAVSAWDGELTHSQLDVAAERLAHYLHSDLGVATTKVVGVCMDKSRWAAVSMLAILKSGGAILPLGNQDPVSRIELLVRNASVNVILTDQYHAKRLRDTTTSKIIIVDKRFVSNLPKASTPPTPIVAPDDAAWIIYTSGSTGAPKGVVLPHNSMATSLVAQGPALGIKRGTRTLQFAAYTFDAAIMEIFTTLIHQGVVCIPSEEQRWSDLPGAISSMKVNLALLTPTVAGLMEHKDVPSLTTLILGGEAVGPAVVDKYLGHATIYNAYGPTECSIMASVSRPMLAATDAPVIGFPITGRFWVTEPYDFNRLVPIGSVGELLIESPQLAREYLNDTEKTSASFVVDPDFIHLLNLGVGHRMYRTGDLVREQEDGSLIHLGRRDTQVKIRGQRVEVGEIEYLITCHPAVKDAVVLLPDYGPLKNKLIATVLMEDSLIGNGYNSTIELVPEQARQAASLQVAEIRSSLSQKLPSHMIPNSWVPLACLPINSSGKVDRKKLSLSISEIDPSTYGIPMHPSTQEMIGDAPATAIERQILMTWAKVLNLEVGQITRDQPFTAAGGDSVLAMRVVSELRKLGITVSVRDILQCQSIAQLSSRAKPAKTYQTALLSHEPFNLSPVQLFFFEDIAADGLVTCADSHFNHGLWLSLNRCFRSDELAHAVETLVARHGMLRARFHHDRVGGWKQRIEKAVQGSYRFHISQVEHDHEVEAIEREANTTLNLRSGPVFSVDILNRKNQPQLMYVVAHHLVIDLVSWRILFHDLEELLQKRPLSQYRSLPFSTWIQLQEHHIRGKFDVHQVLPHDVTLGGWSYWGLTFGEYKHADRVQRSVQLDHATTETLFGSINKILRTEPVEILLAALFHSFHATFEDRSVPAIFNEGHGREPWNESIDLAETIGWFTTMTPFSLTGRSFDILEILIEIKDQRRQIPGRGLPYFSARYLTDEGKKAFNHHRQMEILFNYHGRYQQTEVKEALFQSLNLESLASTGTSVRHPAVFDIDVSRSLDTTQVAFNFSRNINRQDDVKRWTLAFRDSISSILFRLQETKPRYTSSDFLLSRLSNKDLTAIELASRTIPGLGNHDAIEDIYPCSPTQEGMLLSQAKNPADYQVRHCVRITNTDGTLVNPNRVIRAWQDVVDRHTILRTIFVDWLPDQATHLQLVMRSWKTNASVVECGDEHAIKAYAGLSTAVDHIGKEPPHKFTVYRTASGIIFGYLQISHVIVDAWSLDLVFKDLVDAYGSDSVLPPAPQYVNYISYLARSATSEDLDYWVRLLADTRPCYLEIEGPKLSSYTEAETSTQMLPAKVTNFRGLRYLQEIHGITTAMLFRFAWALVLSVYTKSATVNFGFLTHGRDVPVEGIENIAGPTINMTVCHSQIDNTRNITLDAIKQCQEQYLQGLAHQRISLAEIQHALDLSPRTLFNTVMTYRQEESKKTPRTPSLVIEGLYSDDPAEFDITIALSAGSDSVDVDMIYKQSTLSHDVAQRVLDTFIHVASQLIPRGPDGASDLTILSPKDVEQIRLWNTTVPLMVHSLVNGLVKESSVDRPHATAIAAWDGDMTYHELDVRSTALAKYLNSLGAGPEQMVAVCMSKSKWAVVSMLAILKSGAAVVPLGTNHPISRIRLIVRDTACSIILTDAAQAERLTSVASNILVVNDLLLQKASANTVETKAKPEPHNAAWVVFTSGSTGTPKGVILQHDGLCTSIHAHGKKFGVGTQSRVLQFSAHTFDAAIQDIFTTLVFGGCICIVSEEERMNDLAPAMHRLRVNQAFLTPTVAALIQPEGLPHLKTLVIGGEAPSQTVVETWAEASTLLQIYGPSEASIMVTCSAPMGTHSEATNIGYPLASCFWVVDPDNYNNLCPLGVPGELLIEGPLLSRGYLNDAEKTAKSFVDGCKILGQVGIPNRKARLYRTGDLVRQNFDGSLTFLSRIDSQIKIAGQRIETGEIESLISQICVDVRAVVVDLINDPSRDGTKVLVAALELCQDHDDRISEELHIRTLNYTVALRNQIESLQASLADKLPSFMLPTVFLPISNLPLGNTGKLDRRALRLYLESLSDSALRAFAFGDKVSESPSTDAERQLQILWAAVLGKSQEAIGKADHFFEIGGDSVVAMRLVAAARESHIFLTVADVFNHPRLKDLATITESQARVETALIHGGAGEVAPYSLWWKDTTEDDLQGRARELRWLASVCNVSADQIEDVYPCTPLQEGMMAHTELNPSAYVLQAVYKMDGTVQSDRLVAAWDKLVDLVPILRTRIVALPRSKSLQCVIRERIVWTSCTSLQEYLENDRQIPMNSGSHLCRLALIHDDGLPSFLVWTAHHGIYDGWSRARMMQLLAKIYKGEDVPTSPPISRFLQHIGSAEKGSMKVFWQTYLDGLSTTKFPRLPGISYQPHIDATARKRVIGKVSNGRVTTSIALRTAWAIAVAAHTNSSEAVIAVTLSGRDTPVDGILDLLAPTITTVPVRIRIDHNQGVSDLLEEVQRQASEMIPYEHVGLQNIQRLLPNFRGNATPGHLFAVHSDAEISGVPGSVDPGETIGLYAQEAGTAGFDSYPLNIECNMLSDSGQVQIEARFDKFVIPDAYVKNLLDSFAAIFEQICDNQLRKSRIGSLVVVGEGDEDENELSKVEGTTLAARQHCVKAQGPVQKLTNGKDDSSLPTPWVEDAHLGDPDNEVGKSGEHPQVSDLQAQLRRITSLVLNTPEDRVSLHQSFLSLGGDSITAMQMVAQCRREGIQIPMREVLHSKSILQLALTAIKDVVIVGSDETSYHYFCLTPIQQLYFDQIAPNMHNVQGPNRFNQSICIRAPENVSIRDLNAAFDALVRKHPMLRARFHLVEDGWRQIIPELVQGSYHFLVHQTAADDEILEIMEIAESSLDIEKGPTFSVNVIEAPEKLLVYLVAHHLVVDLVSWRIMLHDLDEQLQNPSQLNSENSSTSFQSWSKLQAEYSKSFQSLETVLPIEVPPADWDYWGLQKDEAVFGNRIQETVEMAKSTTSFIFGDCNCALQTEPVDILLAALCQSFHQTFQDRAVPAVFVEGHGREPWDGQIDLTETVGWFTTMTPLHVPLDTEGYDVVETLRQVKEHRRLTPGHGLPYFTARYMTEEGQKRFSSHESMEIVFNYQGQFQQFERGDTGFRLEYVNGKDQPCPVGDNVKDLAVFDVEVTVSDGRLQLSFGFSRHMQDPVAPRTWLHNYATVLEQLSSRLIGMTPSRTPSDFPLANLTQDNIDHIKEECLVLANLGLDDVEDILPVSPMQEGILLSMSKTPGTYHVQFICKISSSLPSEVDTSRIISAWHQVIARHSILRTTFIDAVSGQDTIHQVVLADWIPSVDVVKVVSEHDVEAHLAAARQQRFASHRPNHKLTILCVEGKDVYGHFEMSHALVDASSLQLLIHDLLRAYDDKLPPTQAPKYSSYISYLQKRSSYEDLEYWTQTLRNVQPCHVVTPSDDAPAGERISASFEPPESVSTVLRDLEAFQQFSEKHNVTVATIFQLGWAMVLACQTNLQEVCFGYLVNGRDAPIPGIDEMVGPMINMMVCVVPLNDPTLSVSAAAQQVQRSFLEGFDHQRTSLAAIHHRLQLSGQALFNSTINYKVIQPANKEEQSTLSLESMFAEDPAEYDFGVNITKLDDSIDLSLQYIQAKFSSSFAQGLLDSLVQAVHNLVHVERIGDVQVLSESDATKLKSWNSKIPPRVESCLHTLIKETALQRPNAPAICAWDGEMTHQQLDTASGRLASHLVKLGVGPEVNVGMCMNKSKWAVVSILATLKAGGAVVPLGVQHPVPRIKSILDDTAAAVILVDQKQAKRLETITLHEDRASLLLVGDSLLATLTGSLAQSCQSVSPDNAAWIMYTSGSTGVPKGVVLEHSALCTSVLAFGKQMRFGEHTRALQFSAYTFDVSIMDTVATLICGGGCICIPSEDERMNALTASINRMQVNTMIATPTVADLLDPKKVPLLEKIIVGGEPLTSSLIESWSKNVDLTNNYGMTECCVNSTFSNPLRDVSQKSNIGRALPDAAVFWVVNSTDYNRLVPIGAIGELLIEGPQLARGYLHDPEKTSQAFVTDPAFLHQMEFPETGRRMYRTGDLVRQQEDGSIIYIGRNDTQIKIRGQRIETGEIESAVRRLLPGVQHTIVVLVKRHDSTQQNLTVAVEFESGSKLRSAQRPPEHNTGLLHPSSTLCEAFATLADQLHGCLPSYMVPTAFAPIDRMPLNPSGKLDRRAVTTFLGGLAPEVLSAYSSPTTATRTSRTDAQVILAGAWADVLGIDQSTIGAQDNMFRLGGDSFSAMKLVQTAALLNLRLTVTDIFRNPKLADMAAVAEQNTSKPSTRQSLYKPFSLLNSADTDTLVNELAETLQIPDKSTIEDAFPVTETQEFFVAINTIEPGLEMNYHILDSSHARDASQLRQSCVELFAQVETLRTVFGFHKGRLIQVVLDLQDPPVEVYETDMTIHDFTQDYIKQKTSRPVRLGQLLAEITIVVQQGTNNHRILFRVSHALYDGVAMAMIFSHLSSILAGGQAPQPLSFGPYISSLSSRTTQATYTYWRALLFGAHMPSLLPKPSTPRQLYPLHLLPLRSIPLPTLPSSTSPATLLKAAWALVLASYTSSSDICFVETISGRSSHADAIGCCVSHIPVRFAFSPADSTVPVLLAQVHEQHLASTQHDAIGLGEIVRRCTDWENVGWTTSRMNHQLMPSGDMKLAGEEYKVVAQQPERMENPIPVHVLSFQHEGRVEVGIAYADVVGEKKAEILLDRLCETVRRLVEEPEGKLPVVDKIPIEERMEELVAEESGNSTGDSAAGQDARFDELSAAIREAKFAVLDQDHNDMVALADEAVFGGDVVDALHVACLLQKDGIDVRTEDFLRQPTHEDLVRVVYRREGKKREE